MDSPDYEAFFHACAAAYERSLGGEVAAAADDEGFGQALGKGYAFDKASGTIGMRVERVEDEALWENHDRVRVSCRATYWRKDAARWRCRSTCCTCCSGAQPGRRSSASSPATRWRSTVHMAWSMGTNTRPEPRLRGASGTGRLLPVAALARHGHAGPSWRAARWPSGVREEA